MLLNEDNYFYTLCDEIAETRGSSEFGVRLQWEVYLYVYLYSSKSGRIENKNIRKIKHDGLIKRKHKYRQSRKRKAVKYAGLSHKSRRNERLHFLCS